MSEFMYLLQHYLQKSLVRILVALLAQAALQCHLKAMLPLSPKAVGVNIFAIAYSHGESAFE